MRGRRVGVRPNTPEWLRWRAHGITASDVAAILGLSAYDSPFSLWWRKSTDRQADTLSERERSQRFELGHRLEPVLERFYRDEELPDRWRIGSGGCWQGRGEQVWMRATPDRMLYDRPGTRTPVAVLEFKTDAGGEFGDDLGDGVPEIPVHYRAQVLWQIHVTGVEYARLAVLTSRMQIRYYTIRPQPGEIELLVDAAGAFERSLHDRTPPDLDASEQTLAAVRALNGTVVDEPVEIGDDLAWAYQVAIRGEKAAVATAREAKARMLAAIGQARTAECDGQKIATRTVDKRGVVTLRPATNRRKPTAQTITRQKENAA